ncbi:MAG TPA: hypothetical protein VJ888_01625 [Mobilitalea sp.]|nr:hypothetical protein [Mobilitalea sp.]
MCRKKYMLCAGKVYATCRKTYIRAGKEYAEGMKSNCHIGRMEDLDEALGKEYKNG